jgi:DNA-binding GntR family transcriptional regulator
MLSGTPAFGSDPRGLRRSKVDEVYAALKHAILTGEMPPNAPIDKGKLCEAFGVSRLSITNAVNRLVFDRFVVVEPQRGSYVAKMRLTDAIQWIFVRRAVEVEVAAACAEKLPEDAIARLGHNVAYQETALKGNDLQVFHELDGQFHQIMTDGLGFERVGEFLGPLRAHLDRIRLALLPEPGRIQATYAEHVAIYEAIAARDVSRAKKQMGAHLDRVLQSLKVFAQRRPDLFEP